MRTPTIPLPCHHLLILSEDEQLLDFYTEEGVALFRLELCQKKLIKCDEGALIAEAQFYRGQIEDRRRVLLGQAALS